VAVDEAAVIEADRQQLHKMGYAQELRRGLSTFSNFAISFSIISVLAGALTTMYLPLLAGGPAALNTSWIVIGFFALLVGMAMAEICSAMPTAGGLYYWSAKLAKTPESGAKWSWFTGWFNLLGQIGVIASVDYALSVFIAEFVSLYATSWFGMPILDYKSVFIIYTFVLLAHGLLNTFGVTLVKIFMDISVWWHVLGVAVIVGALLTIPDSNSVVGFGHLCLHHRDADRAVHDHRFRRLCTRQRGDQGRGRQRPEGDRPLDLHLGDRSVDPHVRDRRDDPEGWVRRHRHVVHPGAAADLRGFRRREHGQDDDLHLYRRPVLLRDGIGHRELAHDLRLQP
jgi:hypothetical protein